MARVYVHADASFKNGSAGFGVAIYKKGVKRWLCSDSAKCEGSFCAEVLGLAFALQKAREYFPDSEIVLYNDCRGAVDIINQCVKQGISPKRPHYNKQLSQAFGRVCHYVQMYGVNVRWEKGHANSIGNREADRVARAAMKGQPWAF